MKTPALSLLILTLALFVTRDTRGADEASLSSGDTKSLSGSQTSPYEVKLLADDGTWTWFNDERAILYRDGLYIGSNDSEGRTRVDSYSMDDSEGPAARQEYPLSSWLSKDDHNNPGLLALDSGDLLACYAKHHLEPRWYVRRGHVGEAEAGQVEWSEEKVIEAPAKVTYNNLVQLSEEDGRVFNFMRCVGWNPTLVISDDEGVTWGDPIELIRSGNERTRPYAKYADNGKDRIDLVFTDAHPRNDPRNNVYHLYYQDGHFYQSDGTPVRSLEAVKTQPLLPSEATLIYSAEEAGRGWVWDIEYDESGNPWIAFINSVDHEIGQDLRYRIAEWDAESDTWSQGQIAFAGSRIYEREEHYAGGIALDPENDDQLYLSANVDPVTGSPNATGRYQMFKGTRQGPGDEWRFEQLTFNDQADNLRPTVPRGHEMDTLVIWWQGRYDTYVDYDTRVVGILE